MQFWPSWKRCKFRYARKQKRGSFEPRFFFNFDNTEI